MISLVFKHSLADMYKLLIFVLLFISVSACGEMRVGGHCDYETVLGVARFAGTADGEKPFRFYPAAPAPSHSKVSIPVGIPFSARQPTDVVSIGTPLPAQLSVITTGSCTPYNFMLLSSEHFSHNVLIPFDEQGTVSDKQDKRFSQLGRIYRSLKDVWPELTIELCAATHEPGTDDDNQDLADIYSQQVIEKLVSHGVGLNNVYIVPTENSCGGVAYFGANRSNGVNLSFHLTEGSQSIQREPAANKYGDVRP